MLKASKGKLLISTPSIEESLFFKSIILLTDHSSSGSTGLILNHPSKYKLCDVIQNVTSSKYKIYVGGPVDHQSLHYIHILGDLIPNSIKICDNLYWGGDFNHLMDLINKNMIANSSIRFFIGYCGWDANQLKSELNDKHWIIENSNTKICMQYSNSNLWRDMIKNKTEEYAIWLNLPKDPSLN